MWACASCCSAPPKAAARPQRTGGRALKTLYILRHAKAVPARDGMSDKERPLDPLGRTDAERLGQAMRDAGYRPVLTLCSDALRTRETLAAVSAGVSTGDVMFLSELYNAELADYHKALADHAGAGAVLLVGHNPTCEELARDLTGGDPRLGSGFPTAGLAVIRFADPAAALASGAGLLEAFLSPGRS